MVVINGEHRRTKAELYVHQYIFSDFATIGQGVEVDDLLTYF